MNDSLPTLPPRATESHKGDYGRALLVGGSRGMSGAIALAGMATLRGGAGLVRLVVPDVCLESVAGFDPCYMTTPLPCDDRGRIAAAAKDTITELSASADCVACGPGLGQSDELQELVGWMYRSLQQTLVVDADGLNALAAEKNALSSPGGPRILTPHPGEFRRLTDSEETSRQTQENQAVELAHQIRAVVVLKGHRTLITDGQRTEHNETGNPGMASGGMGDVLTGLVTALSCQGLSPWEAARLGVHLHGLAGDLAAEELGQISLTAADLIDYVPDAFLEWEE